MTIRLAVREAAERLAAAGVDTPLLDAQLLLAHELGSSRERLFANSEEPLDCEHDASFRELIDRRVAGEPVSYLRNSKEFHGLDFYVDRRVLVPRPDTEILVEEALRAVGRFSADEATITLHDSCSGSGCVAVAVAVEAPKLEVSFSDISDEALEVARGNWRRHLRSEPRATQSDLLKSLESRFHIITANPPYLTDEETTRMKETGWPEPAGALCGGPNGLSLIRRLVEQAVDYLWINGYLLLEAADHQADDVKTIMKAAGFADIYQVRDLGDRRRVTIGRLGRAM
jgi:release factor glutamine methyltransferase